MGYLDTDVCTRCGRRQLADSSAGDSPGFRGCPGRDRLRGSGLRRLGRVPAENYVVCRRGGYLWFGGPPRHCPFFSGLASTPLPGRVCHLVCRGVAGLGLGLGLLRAGRHRLEAGNYGSHRRGYRLSRGFPRHLPFPEDLGLGLPEPGHAGRHRRRIPRDRSAMGWWGWRDRRRVLRLVDRSLGPGSPRDRWGHFVVPPVRQPTSTEGRSRNRQPFPRSPRFCRGAGPLLLARRRGCGTFSPRVFSGNHQPRPGWASLPGRLSW